VLAIAAAVVVACTPSSATPSASPTASTPIAVVATPAASGQGTWMAETGIYGTSFHYGPTGYICGIAYNLSYGGGAPLVSVDVGVLFPDAFARHVTPPTVASGWQHPTMRISSPTDVHDAAWLSRLGGGVGGVCNNGPTDLNSLRGSIIKVSWTTVEGSYEQEFRVDDIRGEMTACGTPDGRIHILWGEPRGC
jgi:hypothetical protein